MFEVNLWSDMVGSVEWKWNPFVLGSVVLSRHQQRRGARERMITSSFHPRVGWRLDAEKGEKSMVFANYLLQKYLVEGENIIL